MKNKITIALAILSLVTFSAFSQTKPTVVKLVQTPGKFEGQQLKLKAGTYQFEVSNKGVDHEVAFFLQKEEDKNNKEFSTALKNSGVAKMIKNGETQTTGVVELTKGTYVYSCPLNPTPHYTIIVE
jgi:plastocyanin